MFIDFHKYLLTFVISIIFVFPVIYFSTKNWTLTFICLLVFWIFITLLIELNDYIGKKMHHKIFEKKIFKNLRSGNFQKENIDKYEGLIKTENGRTIRVFYNWNKVAEGIGSFGDIEINLFFEPQIVNRFIDKQKIKQLNRKFDKSFWSKTKRTIFAFDRLKIFINYYPWTKSEKIEKEIERGIKILEQNKLNSFDIRNLKTNELLHFEQNGYFLPNMEYIWEYYETNKKLPITAYWQ